MVAQILPLPGIQAPRTPLGHYLRIGQSAHRPVETLHGTGKFPARRIVVDAAKLKFQRNLITALQSSGTEIILDTNVAELSALGRFDGAVKTAPWASIGSGAPLRPEHFNPGDPHDIYGAIARAAVEGGANAVLAPGHYLRQANRDEWFEVDRTACIELRKALDREGGKHLGIDYLLIPRYGDLLDEVVRGAFLAGLQDLPFDNLWIRASGFGSDGSPSGAQRYIVALASLHNLGKPIVADHVGGLVGLAALAFGAASGLSHGIGEHERFDAGGWHKPRKIADGGQGGGRQVRVSVPDMDRSFTVAELEMLSSARGGHRLVVCGDRDCCPHGRDDMKKNWRAHFLRQRFLKVGNLEAVPDLNRARHFLDMDVAQADRLARQVKDLKIADNEFAKRLAKHARRIESIRLSLENLFEKRGKDSPRAAAPVSRTSQNENKRGEM